MWKFLRTMTQICFINSEHSIAPNSQQMRGTAEDWAYNLKISHQKVRLTEKIKSWSPALGEVGLARWKSIGDLLHEIVNILNTTELYVHLKW